MKEEYMSLTVRELMKKSGVTLKDVAIESSLSIPIVCNILNDELVDRVKKNAMDIIVTRGKENADLAESITV